MVRNNGARSLPWTHRLDVLTPERVEEVRGRSLETLERVGVKVGSRPVRERLADGGAEVEADGERVRFPPEVVERALERVPGRFTLASRSDGWELEIGHRRGYLALDGCAADILDPETGRRRPSTKEDVAAVTRLADGLDEIAFVWQPVTAGDTPAGTQSLHELHAQLGATGKHVQVMTATDAAAARGVVEIARVAAGGEEELRRRPIVSAFQCSNSPLVYEGGAVEAAGILAEAGIPCGFVVMPIACATAPATWAGTLVQSNAEALAGVVILETLVPGAPTFYGSCATVMDLRSGAAACGGPEDLLLQMASAQLARSYGIPSSIGTFATGSKSSDWQAGLENGLSGLASSLAGADMLCGAGLLYAARVCSMEQVVLDAETFSLLGHMLGAEAGTDEALVDLLDDVGPAGDFLGHRHTLTRMRELWQPRLFDRREWGEWEKQGKPGPGEAARERVREILGGERPGYLDEEVDAEIRKILRRYENSDHDG